MQLGIIGLGRMGGNLVQRLTKDGHSCVVYDVNAAAVKALTGLAIQHASSTALHIWFFQRLRPFALITSLAKKR